MLSDTRPKPAQEEDTLELLAVNEETVGRLYSAYAERFPEMSDFWLRLSEEERSHAQLIRGLREQVASGKLIADQRRFRAAAIHTSIDHIRGEIAAAQQAYMQPINALSVANALEQSLMESRAFQIFEADPAELKMVLQRLRDDTARHGMVVRQHWNNDRPATRI
jgi:hypothetical protein